MMRAKKLWNIKFELNSLLEQLSADSGSISSENIQTFLIEATNDEVFA